MITAGQRNGGKHPGRVWLLMILALAATPSARAFSVIEGGSGLDVFPTAPGEDLRFLIEEPTLEVDPGVNTAGGRFACFNFGCQDQFDSFRIFVPQGYRVQEVGFSSGPLLDISGIGEQVGIFAGPADGIGIIHQPPTGPPYVHPPAYLSGGMLVNIFDLVDENDTPTTRSTDLRTGFYDIIVYNFNFVSAAPNSWRLTLVVTPVPLPAALPLLGSAMVMLGMPVLSRRRVGRDRSAN